MLTSGLHAGFVERLPSSNPHNRAAVSCAALDACCAKVARAVAAGAGGDADGTVCYAAERREKLALLRRAGLACDGAAGGAASTVYVTPAEPLPLKLLGAAQACSLVTTVACLASKKQSSSCMCVSSNDVKACVHRGWIRGSVTRSALGLEPDA